MNNHISALRNEKDLLLYEHFCGKSGCNIENFKVQPIERILGDKDVVKSIRLEREAFWIKELRTLTPYGLNDRLESFNWRF